MVEWVRQHNVRYNRRDPRFKEIDHRNSLWQEQADSLGFSADQLKVWWDGLRNRWGQLTKPGKSGSGIVTMTERQRWIVQNFAFLQPYIVRIHSESAVTLTKLAPGRRADSSCCQQ